MGRRDVDKLGKNTLSLFVEPVKCQIILSHKGELSDAKLYSEVQFA